MVSAISDPRNDSDSPIRVNHLWLSPNKDASVRKSRARPLSKIDRSKTDLPKVGPGMGVQKLPPIIQDHVRHTSNYNLQPKNRFMNKKS